MWSDVRKVLSVAVVALAAFVLFASCSPSYGKPPVTGEDTALLDAPFNAIAFDNTGGGGSKFKWLVAQEDGEDITLSIAEAYTETGRPAFYLNGKKVSEAEIDAWQQKTVDARVKVYEDRIEFYGGKVAYNAAPVTASAAPVYPQSAPYLSPFVQPGVTGSPCQNGQCQPAPTQYPRRR